MAGDTRGDGAEGSTADAGGDAPAVGSSLRRFRTWFLRLKLVRVIRNYSANRGPLLAAGLSFHAVFATFASLWLGFSIGGLLLETQPGLRDAVFDFLDRAVPGLFTGGAVTSGGAIDRGTLLQARVLGLTGAVALLGLLVTTLGWLASCRAAVRTIFHLPGASENPLLLKLKDLGLVVAVGAAVLVSAALTVLGSRALGLFGAFVPAAVVGMGGRILSLAVMFAFDSAMLAALFRVLAGIAIPMRRLVGGVLIGAAGLGLLKIVGGTLLDGASRNPLLASFAIIIGLMVWFNLVSQVILLAASWVAVGARDHGVDIWQDDED